MPTILDSLFVELGLDASKFNAAQKKSIEQLKQFETASEKAGKASQLHANAMTGGFDKLKNSIMGFGGAFLTIAGFQKFVTTMTEGNAALGRASRLLSMGGKDLTAWGDAAKTVGGSLGGFEASLQNIEGGLAKFHMGQGGENIVQALAMLGVQAKNGTVDLYALSDALVKMKNERGIQTAHSFAEQLGMDEGTFNLLMKGSEGVRKLTEEMAKNNHVTEGGLQASEELKAKWEKLGVVATATGQSILDDLNPALNKAIDLMTNAVSMKSDFTAGMESIAKGDWITALTQLSVGDFRRAFKMHMIDGLTNEQTAAAMNSRTPEKGSADQAIKYFQSKGWSKEQSIGMAANISRESNFNAGAVGDNGAAYGLGQWHKDRQDKFEKLFGHPMQKSTTEEQLAFYDWELNHTEKSAGDKLRGAKTAEDSARIVSSQFERPGDASGEMSKRAAIASSMVGAQANAPTVADGGSTVETHINTINVNTQATDANGIGRDMKTALQQNSLIGAGMVGIT